MEKGLLVSSGGLYGPLLTCACIVWRQLMLCNSFQV